MKKKNGSGKGGCSTAHLINHNASSAPFIPVICDHIEQKFNQ